MADVYAFHQSVTGHAHKMKQIPCQDASDSFSCSGNKRYSVIAVADGHGSSACFRSDRGSKFAVSAAMNCLRQYAENLLMDSERIQSFIHDVLHDPSNQKVSLHQLTNSILARWYDNVMQDYRSFPLQTEEKEAHPELSRPDVNIAHIYGTTLIAALWLPFCLILIQQGDGRCDVFYQDGSVEQPIPWDELCQENITTSMCDRDAATRIRSCIINSQRKKPIACFLGSDGIEDSYRDTYENFGGKHILMGGVHVFNKAIIGRILQKIGLLKEFEKELEPYLQNFSANGQFGWGGSGDDVSIAGIVSTIQVSQFQKKYNSDVMQYGREEKLFWLEDSLRSKSRKLKILERRVTEARKRNSTQEELDQANRDYLAFKKEYDEIQERVINLKGREIGLDTGELG